jgi:membrane protease subunit (stomatin/prohibitin family)
MDFVKGGVREMMIARPDNLKYLIVYKHPDETVPMWSQLTVDSDEGCVFFRDGQVFGILGPGRHTLDSSNIPFLGQLVDKFTGGNVFKAEVFFVRNQPLRNDPVKFGGKVSMSDPVTTVTCQPMIHGEFVPQVMDPVKFIIGLTGQHVQPHDNQAILKYVGDKFRSGVRQALATVLHAEKTSILEYDMVRPAIEAGFKQSVPDLNEVGLRVSELVDFVVKLSPQDREKLEKIWDTMKVRMVQLRADMEAKRLELEMRQMEIGVDVSERQQYVNMAQNPAYMAHAQAEAMMSAGRGMEQGGGDGAGIAGMGAQMAMGVGMAGMFQQGFYQPAPNPQPVAAPPGGSVTCSACGTQNAGGKFCANCGKPLAPPPSTFCSNCGSNVAGKFCANCGTASAGGGGAPPQGGPPQGGAPPGGAPPGGAPQGGYPPAPAQGAAPGGYPPAQGAPQGYPQAPQGGAYPQAPQGQGGGYPPPQQGGYPQAPQQGGYPQAPQGQGPQGGQYAAVPPPPKGGPQGPQGGQG